jgi:alpha 1,2-mannosyltransferase
MRQIEDRFNHQFHYSWVFLNDEPFTQEFRRLTTGMASGEVEYGLIEKDQWQTPSWIDTEKAQKAMEEMVRKDVIYGGSVSYRYIPFRQLLMKDTCAAITQASFSVILC